MDWLNDDSIAEFLDSGTRTEVFSVDRLRTGVLCVRTGAWLGMIVQGRHGFDAFSPRIPLGRRVKSFSAALQVVELTSTAVYRESVKPIPVEEEATDGD